MEITSSADGRIPGTYHPTFLYESLWCIGVAVLVIWADRRFKLGHGRAFALYVAGYCAGRAWIEYMRVDDAHEILGLRLNNWTAMLVFVLAVLYLVLSASKRPGREEIVEPGAGAPAVATVTRWRSRRRRATRRRQATRRRRATRRRQATRTRPTGACESGGQELRESESENEPEAAKKS